MSLVRTVRVNLNESGGAAVKAKLDAVAKRADELGRMDPSIRVEVNTAAASARLAILAEELRRVDDIGNKGFKFNLGSGLPGFLGSIQKGLTGILNMGPQAIPVLAGIAAAVLAITVYLSSLITQLSAATIGVGAFAAFAIPTFMKIASGISDVSKAAGKVRLDSLVKGITDAQKAADKLALSKAWAAIPAALRPAVRAGLDLKTTFDKLVTAMRPQAVQIFADALKGVRNVLPLLLPIAQAAGKAIDGLLKGFDSFSRSAGFKSFLSEMRRLAGPAISAIGKGLGEVAIALGNVVKAGDNPTGIRLLAATFKILAGAINGIAWAARTSESALTGLLKFAASLGRGVINAARSITDAFLTMAGAIAHVAAKIPGPWQSSMRSIAHSIDQAKFTANQFFDQGTARLNKFTAAINNAKPIYRMRGDISDLEAKVAAAKARIHSVPPSHQTAIRASIAQAERQIAAIRAQLAALNGTVATTYVQTIPIGGGAYLHHAAGGPSSGLTWVGERGPELVYTPPGSYVYTNDQSKRMTAMSGPGGGGGGDIYIDHFSVHMPPGADGASVVRVLQKYASDNGPIKLRVRS